MRKRRPYSRRIKRPVTLRLEEQIIAYFNQLAQDLGIPYQTLINLYLRDCAKKRMRPRFDWKGVVARGWLALGFALDHPSANAWLALG